MITIRQFTLIVTIITVLLIAGFFIIDMNGREKQVKAGTNQFILNVAPTFKTIWPGGSVSYLVEIKFADGFNSDSTFLWTAELPVGVTAKYKPNPMPHQGKSILTISADRTVALGTYTFVTGATSNGLTNSQKVTLTVTDQPDFSINSFPVTQNITAGGNVSYNIDLKSLNGFSNSVNLSISGLPPGAKAALDPNSIIPSGLSVLTVSPASDTPAGSYHLKVNGTSGSLTKTADIVLMVSKSPVWTISSVGTTGADNNTVRVGQVRNDGINRVYVGTITKGRIFEFSWDSSKSNWSPPIDIGGSSKGGEIHNMTIGSGRNDKIDRLYACSLTGELYEIFYTNNTWIQSAIGVADGPCLHTVVGQGRNDGVDRLYATRGRNIYEYTWRGNGWEVVFIGGVSRGRAHGITMGKRWGSVGNYLYIASSASGTYEAAFSNGKWSLISMGDSGDVRNVGVGPGRNDGINRVYAALAHGVLREFSWDNGWRFGDISRPTKDALVHAYINNGRNDGVMRIYSSAGNGNAYEFTYDPSSASWKTVTLGGGSGYLYGFHYGYGRNDGKIRLYGGSFNNRVYEYTW